MHELESLSQLVSPQASPQFKIRACQAENVSGDNFIAIHPMSADQGPDQPEINEVLHDDSEFEIIPN